MGRYIVQSDLEAAFGADAIAQWSNTENSAAGADTARIASAIAYGEDVVDARFRGSRYLVPFAATSAAMPRQIVEWCCVAAARWLYEHRGRRDGDGDAAVSRLDALEKKAMGEIDSALAGVTRLPLTTVSRFGTAPRVSR